MQSNNVVIVSAMRTAIGGFGGTLKNVSAIDLGTATAEAAINKAQIQASDVEQSFYGHVIHTQAKDMYLSRVIAMQAGVPETSPALTVNRLCGSGLQAIVSAIQTIALGDANIALAGGAENMSQGGYLTPSMRWGQRMGDTTMVDMMANALQDPFGNGHMGITAENIAAKYDISRADQDAFAAQSHNRTEHAIALGYFKEQIVPIAIKHRKGEQIFDTDEHYRAGVTAEDMQKLRPAFKKDGLVTAGNASGINDGAASLILMNEEEAKRRGLKPLAKVVSYGLGGVAPEIMGMGPVPAMQQALTRANLAAADLDVIESNEAFAAQACAVSQQLQLDSNKVNPNGGAIALGHPVGASGAIITTKLLHELQRTQGKYGAATMCIGGGQGIAVIFEAM